MHIFELNGKPVEIVPLSEMTVKELRLAKQTAGMTPSAIAAVLDEMDPDAWLAVLLVSSRRVDPLVTVEELEESCLGDLIAKLGEETESGPPSEGATAPEPDTTPPSSESSTDGPDETTPDPSGHPV